MKHAIVRNEFPSDEEIPVGAETFPPLGIPEEELAEGQAEVPVPHDDDNDENDDEIVSNNGSEVNEGLAHTPCVPGPSSNPTPVTKKRRPRKHKVYPIERILGKRRGENGETRYKIRWRNHNADMDSFEPYANLDKATQAYVKKCEINIPDV